MSDINELLDDQLRSGDEHPPLSLELWSKIIQWTRIAALVGVVIVIFSIVNMVYVFMLGNHPSGASSIGAAMGGVFIFVILFTLFFYLVPLVYLFKFNRHMKSGLEHGDSVAFENAILNMKSMFKFFGIVIIVLLSIYALMFLVGGLGFLFAG